MGVGMAVLLEGGGVYEAGTFLWQEVFLLSLYQMAQNVFVPMLECHKLLKRLL
jgi:hypothetical protein